MIALGIRYFFVSEWLLIVPQCFFFLKETCPALIIGCSSQRILSTIIEKHHYWKKREWENHLFSDSNSKMRWNTVFVSNRKIDGCRKKFLL